MRVADFHALEHDVFVVAVGGGGGGVKICDDDGMRGRRGEEGGGGGRGGRARDEVCVMRMEWGHRVKVVHYTLHERMFCIAELAERCHWPRVVVAMGHGRAASAEEAAEEHAWKVGVYFLVWLEVEGSASHLQEADSIDGW